MFEHELTSIFGAFDFLVLDELIPARKRQKSARVQLFAWRPWHYVVNIMQYGIYTLLQCARHDVDIDVVYVEQIFAPKGSTV